MHAELLSRTRELIAGCDCLHGCPTCVGPVGNTGPLAKVVALRILDLMLAGAEAPARSRDYAAERLRGMGMPAQAERSAAQRASAAGTG